jgi:tetratricopeptide (TPR) repeat protein
LAAARTSVLSPTQIVERLSQRLDLLKGGMDVEARQQTLRATIEWSHDLLDQDEQRLFARLAVFRGGCTLDAAEQVADAEIDRLQALVDKSLLRHTGDRFWFLETIREHARERLTSSGEEAEMRRRHAFFALDFAEAYRAVQAGDQATNFARTEAEHDNLRSALEWARDSGANEVLLRLAAALVNHWRGSGQFDEADEWCSMALARATSPARARMKALRHVARRAMEQGESARADALIEEARCLAEHAGDEVQILRAMNLAALSAAAKGDLDDARAQLETIRDRAGEFGDLSGAARAAINLSDTCLRAGDYDAALDNALEAVDPLRELGNDYGVGLALANAGQAALRRSDLVRAEGFFREASAVFNRIGAIHQVAWCVPGIAAALVAREPEAAAQLLGAAASLREELGIGFADDEDEQLNDRCLAEANAALGDEAFRAAWARGDAITAEETITLAQAVEQRASANTSR